MASKETTQYLLADAIKDLMRTQSLDKINDRHRLLSPHPEVLPPSFRISRPGQLLVGSAPSSRWASTYTLREGLLKSFNNRAEQLFSPRSAQRLQ